MWRQEDAIRFWQPGGREAAIQRLSPTTGSEPARVDILVIGGGITGAGIFREAVRRNLSVLLVDQKDFAWGTSSKSSKMVHGGLRYLASGDFRLTRDSVRERQRLLAEVPGLVDPLPFLMPHYQGTFPGPRLFHLVLAIYDWMAGKWNHQFRHKREMTCFAPGIRQAHLLGATEFGDAVTDDARLVLRVLQEGVSDGGVALNYLRARSIERGAHGENQVLLEDVVAGRPLRLSARVVINATGAWTDILRKQLGADARIRPLRGSHLVFPAWRLPVASAVSFFHPKDKRPVFAFPWEGVTVVGTTDIDHQWTPGSDIRITQQEADYLLDAVLHEFPGTGLTLQDVVSCYSGVRPVVGSGALNPSRERREHSVWDDGGVISVAGGKLTTFRLIARDVLASAARYLPMPEPMDDRVFHRQAARPCPHWMPVTTYQRLCGRYGLAFGELVTWMNAENGYNVDLSTPVGTTRTLWVELVWACRNELVVHLDDLLLRRTRIGLLLESGGSACRETIRAICQRELGWSDQRWETEWSRYLDICRTDFSLPDPAAESDGNGSTPEGGGHDA